MPEGKFRGLNTLGILKVAHWSSSDYLIYTLQEYVSDLWNLITTMYPKVYQRFELHPEEGLRLSTAQTSDLNGPGFRTIHTYTLQRYSLDFHSQSGDSLF